MENAELHVKTQAMANKAGEQPAQSGSENCLAIGTRLSEFELTGVVGEGGFGSVYLAFDHSLQRTVAIKEYMPGALAGRGADKSVVVRSERHKETFETGLKSFINEARLLAQFDHPALIKVHRFWEQNNTGYMAMRYYEGQTLKNIIKHHPAMVTEEWLKSILKPILEALDALYKVQILHRDISPDNIMIQKNGEAVLLDFGAARQIIGDMTQALTVILKPGYAPVEQYADDVSMKQGPWTDIYALSAVMYAAIVKKPPPTSVARMIKDPIEPLQSGAYPGFSPLFLAAIDKGLSVKPEDRPQSIEAFRRLLGIAVAPSAPLVLPPAAPAAVGKAQDAKDPSAGATVIIKPKPKTASGKVEKKAQLKEIRPPSTAPKAASNKSGRAALALGLACVLGLGAYFAYLVLNPGTAPAAISGLMPKSAPSVVAAAPVAAPLAPQPALPDEETLAWDALKDNAAASVEALSDFLAKYPAGKYAEAAHARLSALNLEATKLAAAKEASAAAAAAADKPDEAKQAALEAEAAKVTGTVTLTIKPWGTILVDDAPKGTSPPLKKLKLPEGKHQIKIVNANFPNYVTEIEVAKKKPVLIEHDFSALQRTNTP